jgi:hypothetical protein
MRMTFASRDAAHPHMCSGNRLETYAGTPVDACAHKVVEVEHQFVQLQQGHTAVLEQQVSAQHN